MLQILLMILKILGILLLVILGIILAVLLVVLFVPLRYQGDVSFDEKPKGGVLVSWLLRIVTVRVDYDGSALKALVKVLWFRLFEQTLWPSEDTEDVTDDLAEEVLPDDEFFGNLGDAAVAEPVKTGDGESVEQAPLKHGSAKKEAVNEESKQSASAKRESIQKEPLRNVPHQNIPHQNIPEPDVSEPEKPPVIETMIAKIQSVVTKIVVKVRTMYTNLTAKYAAGQDKIDMVRTFLGDEENKNTLRLLWRQVMKLLKHILPRKMNGRVKFGFDDPATTGQVLTYISPFYGMYAKSVTVEPVFDEKVMEGELHVKGHIRVASLIWIVIRVFFNKNFRMLLKKFLKRNK